MGWYQIISRAGLRYVVVYRAGWREVRVAAVSRQSIRGPKALGQTKYVSGEMRSEGEKKVIRRFGPKVIGREAGKV